MTRFVSILILLAAGSLNLAWGADPSAAIQSYQSLALGPIMAVVIGLAMLAALYQYVMGNKAAVIWIILGILFLMVVKSVVGIVGGGGALNSIVAATIRYPTLGVGVGPPLGECLSDNARHGIENWAVLGLDIGGRFLAGLFQAGVVGIALIIIGLTLGWRIMVGHEGGAAVRFFLLAIIVALFCGVPTVAFVTDQPGGAGNFIRDQDGTSSQAAVPNCALLPSMVIVGSNHLAEVLATTMFRAPATENQTNRAYQASKSAKMDSDVLEDYSKYSAACAAATQGMMAYNKKQATESGSAAGAAAGGNSTYDVWMGQLRDGRVNTTKQAFGMYTGLTASLRAPLTPAWDAATAWVPLDGYAYLGDWTVPTSFLKFPDARAVISPYSAMGATGPSPSFVGVYTNGTALNVGGFLKPPGGTFNILGPWSGFDWRIYRIPMSVDVVADNPDPDQIAKVKQKLMQSNLSGNFLSDPKMILRYCTLPIRTGRGGADPGGGDVTNGGSWSSVWNFGGNVNSITPGTVLDPYSMTIASLVADKTVNVAYLDAGDLIRSRIAAQAVNSCDNSASWSPSDPHNWGCIVFEEFSHLVALGKAPAATSNNYAAFNNSLEAERAFWHATYPGATPNANRFIGSSFPRAGGGTPVTLGANIGWLHNVATSQAPNTNAYGFDVTGRYEDLTGYAPGYHSTASAFQGGNNQSSSFVNNASDARWLRTKTAFYLSGTGIQAQLGNSITGAVDTPQKDQDGPGWSIPKILNYIVMIIPTLLLSLMAGLAWLFKEIIMLVVPILIGVGFMVVYMLYPVFFVVALTTGRVTLLLDWAKAVLWVSFWPVFYVISDRLIQSVSGLAVIGIGPAGGMGGAATIFVSAGVAMMAPALSMVLINPSMGALAGSVNSVYGAGMQIVGAATKILLAVAAGIGGAAVGMAAGAVVGKASGAAAAKASTAASQMGGSVAQGGGKAAEAAGNVATRAAQYMGRSTEAMLNRAGEFGGSMADALGAGGFSQGMGGAAGVADSAGGAARAGTGRVLMGAAIGGARKHLKREQADFASGKTSDSRSMEAAEANLQQWQGMAEQGVAGGWAQISHGTNSAGDLTNRGILAGARETQGRRATENAQQYRMNAENAKTPAEREEWKAQERGAAATAMQAFGQAAAIHTDRGDFQAASTSLLAAGQAATAAGDSRAGGDLLTRAAHSGNLALAEAHKRGDQRGIQEARFTNAAVSQGRAENYIEQSRSMLTGSPEQGAALASAVHEAGKAQSGFAVVQNQAQDDLVGAISTAQNEKMTRGSVSPQTKARMVDAVSRLSQSRSASNELEETGAHPQLAAMPGVEGKFRSTMPAPNAALMGSMREALTHANDGAPAGQSYTMEGAIIAAAISPTGIPSTATKSVPITILTAARDYEGGLGGAASVERVQIIDQVTTGIRNSTNSREMSDSLAQGVGFQAKRRFLADSDANRKASVGGEPQ